MQSGYAPPCQFTTETAFPFAINEVGQVLGQYGLCAGNGETFLWTGTTHFVAPYRISPTGVAANPHDLNSSGTIVGTTSVPARHGFLYDHGTWTDLGVPAGGTFSEALAISDNGKVVGYWGNNVTGNPAAHAYVWENGQMTDLNLPMDNAASAINGSGQIVGWMGVSYIPPFPSQAFLWQNGVVTVLPLPPGAINGEARAISNNGKICGVAGYPNAGGTGYVRRPFVIINGVVSDIPLPPGILKGLAVDINDLGQMVGYYEGSTDAPDVEPVFIWQNGVTTPLQSLLPPGTTIQLQRPAAINNQGQIAAVATDGFQVITVLLSPVPSLTGDFNCDRRVNVDDLLGVINHWGPVPGGAGGHGPADFNADGMVNVDDLLIVIMHWTG